MFGKITNYLKIDRTFASIALAAFAFSAGGGILLIAVPFVVKGLGGTDGDVGVSLALNFSSYFMACLAVSFVIHRFNPKRSTQFGSIGCGMAIFGC